MTHPTCIHDDSDIIFDTVRQFRKWRGWLLTAGIAALVGIITTILIFMFDTGSAVGAAERDLTYLERATDTARAGRNELRRDHLEALQKSTERYEKIQQALHSIDNRLGRLEERTRNPTPRRGRR